MNTFLLFISIAAIASAAIFIHLRFIKPWQSLRRDLEQMASGNFRIPAVQDEPGQYAETTRHVKRISELLLKLDRQIANEDLSLRGILSGMVEGILIIVAALGIVWTAAHRFSDPQPLQEVGLGLALSVGSSMLNGLLAWVMMGAARQHRSMALEADAKHLVTDVWTSVGVVLGIVLVQWSGWLWLDAVVAIAVALNIFKEGVHLIWRSSQGLMDEAVEPETMQHIQDVLDSFAHQRGTTNIIRFDHVTTRRAGQRRFVDVHMHMPASWSLGRAAALRTSVEQALMSAVPGLRASIQLLPSDVEAHFDDVRDLK